MSNNNFLDGLKHYDISVTVRYGSLSASVETQSDWPQKPLMELIENEQLRITERLIQSLTSQYKNDLSRATFDSDDLAKITPEEQANKAKAHNIGIKLDLESFYVLSQILKMGKPSSSKPQFVEPYAKVSRASLSDAPKTPPSV